MIVQGEYIDGRREGTWTYVHGDHREEGAYKDGLREGTWNYTYPNGKRNFVGDFVNGEPHGKHRWWWPNGQLKQEARYTMGLAQGDVVHYDTDGRPVLVVKYKDGVEMKLDGEKLPLPGPPAQ